MPIQINIFLVGFQQGDLKVKLVASNKTDEKQYRYIKRVASWCFLIAAYLIKKCDGQIGTYEIPQKPEGNKENSLKPKPRKVL